MSIATVIASFVLCLFFNVFLNSFDIYADIALASNTLTFNLGESLLLSGCQVCHGKDDKDVFTVKNASCQQCLTKNSLFRCGDSFEILDKLNKLENSESCLEEKFSVYLNSTTKSYIWRDNSCTNEERSCCVENRPRLQNKNPLDWIDKRIIAHQTEDLRNIRHDIDYNVFILSGRSSQRHCQRIFLDFNNGTSSNIKSFLDKHIPKAPEQNAIKQSYRFRRSVSGETNLEKGFNADDECGIYVEENWTMNVTNNGVSCGSDLCLIHLQRLKWNLNISNIDDWSQQTFFNLGKKLGGKTCKLLFQYGVASLVPIVIHIVFNMVVYLEDLNSNKSTKKEVVFVLLGCYPQTKCLKFMFQFLCHKDEKKFNQDKDNFDDRLGLLEPFIESSFQVSVSI